MRQKTHVKTMCVSQIKSTTSQPYIIHSLAVILKNACPHVIIARNLAKRPSRYDHGMMVAR